MLDRLKSTVTEMAKCKRVGKLLQSYIDGEVDIDQIELISNHLETCLKCGMNYEIYSDIKHALQLGHFKNGALHEDALALQRLKRFVSTLDEGCANQ